MRKALTSLSVRLDLVRRANALELNLSELLEEALVRAIADKERQLWLADNQESICKYNARIARTSAFSDDWRRF